MSSSSKPTNVSAEMGRRMNSILMCPANMVCADCPSLRPQWVSFLYARVQVDKTLAVLCCDSCVQHHYFELGKKRCMIKSLKMVHEWTMEDVQTLEYSGNAFVNNIFEGNLTYEDYIKTEVLKDEDEEFDQRGRFIKNKYKRRKWQDDVEYHKMMLELLLKKRGHQCDHENPTTQSSDERHEGDEEYETKTVSRRVNPRSKKSLRDRIGGMRKAKSADIAPSRKSKRNPPRRSSCDSTSTASSTASESSGGSRSRRSSRESRDRRQPSRREMSRRDERSSRRTGLSRCASDPTAIQESRLEASWSNLSRGGGRQLGRSSSHGKLQNSLSVIEAPKSAMRERRLNAFAKMFVVAVPASDDGRRQRYNQAA
ncbi:expressed unknown protein [Seminavis robusta]|uniref:Arf-GAP domain-containing protein n=1 Tax=Seminavis robusta TaxID=568900 RepID=A0A9N8DVR8_9STRA|nr:expressed unknown protein [Seminavis robusta]|eukprot:Sro380_g130610.1 n/a (369) ;mRNA; r:17473-18670